MSFALPADRLDAIIARHGIISATLNAGPDPESFVALSREFAELDPVVGAIRAYHVAQENLRGIETLLEDASTDPEMRALAADERPAAAENLERAAQAL